MPQISKKDQIADAALPVFLENGIKGTSIDLVVKTSGVSKPTVYNHFPDKATLLCFVVERWAQNQPVPVLKAKSERSLTKDIKTHWLNPEATRFYGLFMGEGERAKAAKQFFKEHYDAPWRLELKRWSKTNAANEKHLEALVHHCLVQALF